MALTRLNSVRGDHSALSVDEIAPRPGSLGAKQSSQTVTESILLQESQ